MLSFEVNKNLDVCGTCFQGTVKASYQQLVDLFGLPQFYGDNKIQAEWRVLFSDRFSDGTINYVKATIYDWKQDKDPETLVEWHVGGNSFNACILVNEALELHQHAFMMEQDINGLDTATSLTLL